jgi:PKD repeat protein
MFMSQDNRLFSILICFVIASILLLSGITIPLTSLAEAEDEERTISTRATKPTGNGPYSTAWVYNEIPRPGDSDVPSRIYFPTSGGGQVNPTGAPYNGIVFAPGAGGGETSYAGTLSTIASWGFIVAIVGTGGPCNQEVVDIQSYVIDHFEDLNTNSSSVFHNKINTTACGGSGHSNGGWTAIAGAVADDRFQAVCTLAAAAGPNFGSGQANTGNLHVPLQLVAGADDTTYIPSSDAYYALANPIKSYMKITGAGHGGPFKLEYLVSFYKMWLNNDDEYCTFIYGEELQKDIDNNVIEYTSDIGLEPSPTISSSYVYEDENITFTAGGNVVTPNPPDRMIAKYQWDFDFDGTYDWESANKDSTKYNYEQKGTYSVGFKITDSWGLTASKEYSIVVENMVPASDAGTDVTADEDQLISFDAGKSTDTASDIVKLLYQWDFGDGNTTAWELEPTATYTYSEQGEYTVKVTVKDDDDSTSIDSLKVKINNVVPTANLSANKTTIKIAEPVYFNADLTHDTSSDFPYLEYHWDFGDGKTSTERAITHFYLNDDNYTVTLTVRDDNGAVSRKTLIITVLNNPPTCRVMNDLEVNEDDDIVFTGTGYDSKADEKDLEYSWNLDIPGMEDTPWDRSPDFDYTYTEAGVYYVTLSVRDDNGDIGTDIVRITVKNVVPTAEFTLDSDRILEDEKLFFNGGKSTDSESDQKTLNYTWDLGPNIPLMFGKSIYYTYSKAGLYTVRLTVTDDDGDIDSMSESLAVENVEPSAVIIASDSKVQIGSIINFTAGMIEDTESDLDSLTFNWNFGDKTQADGEFVNHSYTEPGLFTVTLVVTDDNGASSSSVLIISVTEIETQDVAEPKEAGEELNLAILGIVIAILVVILVVLLVLIQRKKKKKPGAVQGPVGDQVIVDAEPFVPVMPGYEQYPPQQSFYDAGTVPYDQQMVYPQEAAPIMPVQEQGYPSLMAGDTQAQITPDTQTAPVMYDQPQQVPEQDKPIVGYLPPGQKTRDPESGARNSEPGAQGPDD